jgi:hypothetical protein
MSEGHIEERPGDLSPGPEPGPRAAAEPARRQRAAWSAVLWLLAVLFFLIGAVALSPFWAPDVAALLPWGARPGASPDDYTALAARVAAIEKRAASPGTDADALKSSVGAVGRRIDQLETAMSAKVAEIEKRPASPASDIDAIKLSESALARRIDQLEAARNGSGQVEASVAATRTDMQQLEQRVASEIAEAQKVHQELSKLGTATSDLASRLQALEQRVQSQSGAERTDAALAMVLLQMREAVEQARPFPAEYGTFKALARDPELVAQAAPLAEAAQNGVASRTVLSKRLTELSGRVATATEPPAESDWGVQALARLRGLVTIRRIDSASQTGPEAAVTAAQAALTRGDLAGAVADLERLGGANAEAALPWLRMARERLAVETALDHMQQLLAARLGTRAAPAEPSAGARTPS